MLGEGQSSAPKLHVLCVSVATTFSPHDPKSHEVSHRVLQHVSPAFDLTKGSTTAMTARVNVPGHIMLQLCTKTAKEVHEHAYLKRPKPGVDTGPGLKIRIGGSGMFELLMSKRGLSSSWLLHPSFIIPC